MMIRTPDLLIPAADEVKRRLISAAMQVYKNDKYLLDYNVSERAITHRLAVYLEKLFPSGMWTASIIAMVRISKELAGFVFRALPVAAKDPAKEFFLT